jgi:predicted amidohydrolase YtcJ
VYQLTALAPPLSGAQLVGGLRKASAAYAALGVATIREALISVDELGVYQTARDQGALLVRVRPLIRVPHDVGADAAVAMVEGLGFHSGFGDDRLRVWGLKVVLDGGVEGGAMEDPYANDPSNSGHLNWDPDALFEVCAAAVRRGWRIGTHAAGDRAVRIILDVYERVITAVGGVPPATLVIEHALVVDAAQQRRAVRLGVAVTVQHALLWNMASEMLTTWGPERTARVGPIDEWLALGAIVAAGTDIVRPFNPMTNVWGMATRGTRSAGVQGGEHAIERDAAIDLYTTGGARLDGEADLRGTITAGALADLVAYPANPFTVDLSELAELTPLVTIIDGRAAHDPGGRVT